MIFQLKRHCDWSMKWCKQSLCSLARISTEKHNRVTLRNMGYNQIQTSIQNWWVSSIGKVFPCSTTLKPVGEYFFDFHGNHSKTGLLLYHLSWRSRWIPQLLRGYALNLLCTDDSSESFTGTKLVTVLVQNTTILRRTNCSLYSQSSEVQHFSLSKNRMIPWICLFPL